MCAPCNSVRVIGARAASCTYGTIDSDRHVALGRQAGRDDCWHLDARADRQHSHEALVLDVLTAAPPRGSLVSAVPSGALAEEHEPSGFSRDGTSPPRDEVA